MPETQVEAQEETIRRYTHTHTHTTLRCATLRCATTLPFCAGAFVCLIYFYFFVWISWACRQRYGAWIRRDLRSHRMQRLESEMRQTKKKKNNKRAVAYMFGYRKACNRQNCSSSCSSSFCLFFLVVLLGFTQVFPWIWSCWFSVILWFCDSLEVCGVLIVFAFFFLLSHKI